MGHYTRDREAKKPAVALEPISGAIESFSRQFTATVERLQADDQAENPQRRSYEASELKRTKIGARAAIGLSVVSLILSGLTLAVLYKTLGVYQGQATIMGNQAIIMDRQRDVAEQS